MHTTVAAFDILCRQIESHSEFSLKEDIVRGFLAKYGGSKVLLFKLLLPRQADRKYHLGDKQLVKIWSRLLGCEEKGLQGKVNASGDVAESVSNAFSKSALCKRSTSAITLEELDAHLAALSKVTTEAEQSSCFTKFAAVASGVDMRCYLRLVKHDLRLNAGVKCILNGLDAKAYDMYKTCSSISKVVCAVTGEDGGDDESASPAGSPRGRAVLGAGTPVLPMLARPAKSIDDVLKRCPNTSYSEIKYDGERIQIHKNGASLSYWARSLRPMKEDKYDGLGPVVQAAVKADNCILDGEILLVDNTTGRPLPFGTLGKHKKAAFKDASTCIFLFDMLYLNGESLLDRPLEERRRMMKDTVKFVLNRLMLSELQHIRGTVGQQQAMLRKHLHYAVAQGLEGLVIKDIKSTYNPAARHWIKLKRDYLSGMADSADLVPVGGYYGTGAKGGMISVFLMGCRDGVKWKTVCKVGNGFDDATLAKVNKELKMREIGKRAAEVPPWLVCHSSHTPDFVVADPKASPVWEVIGAEFTLSKTHTADGICFRFPRVVKVREDKTWEQATDLPQLRRIYDASKSLAKDAAAMDMTGMTRTLALEAKRTDSLEAEDMDGQPALAPAPAAPAAAPAAAVPAPAPAPAAAPAPPAAPAGPSSVTYVLGDAAHPVTVSTASNLRIIAHSVALSGRWSGKGVMGQITAVLGDEPQEEYDAASDVLSIGDVQFVSLSDPFSSTGRLEIATMVCQHAASKDAHGRRGVPPFDQSAFEKALGKVLARAARERASVHLTKLMDRRMVGLDWGAVDKAIRRLAAAHGAPVWVYTKSEEDKRRFHMRDASPPKVASPPKPAPAKPAPSPSPVASAAAPSPVTPHRPPAFKVDSQTPTLDLGMGSDMGSPPRASLTRQPTVKATQEETLAFFDSLNEVFAKTRFVVSGYAPREAKAVVQKVEMMGGVVQPRWVSFGGSKTDFLVCETLTAEHERVEKLGGVIVTRKFVAECFRQCRRLDPSAPGFAFDPQADVSSVLNSEPAESKPSLLRCEPTVTKRPRDPADTPPPAKRPREEAAAACPMALDDIFTGCRVFLYQRTADAMAAELKRYIIAYDGDVVDAGDAASATHAVAVAGAEGMKERLRACGAAGLSCLRPDWVWASVRARALAAPSAHQI